MVATGTDFAGVDDIDAAWRFVGGRLATAQALGRAITTPLGSLPDWPDYGYDLLRSIGTSQSDTQIKQGIQGQAGLIETIESVTTTIDRSTESAGDDLIIKIEIFDADGPFSLTVNISDLEVTSIVPAGV